jgi:outer membrane protein
MKIMKKWNVLISVALLTSSMGVGQVMAADTSSQIKVAIVNVQQVLQQSPRVTELSKKLENQFKTRQTKINDEQKSLQDQLDKFKKESPTMSQKDKDSVQKKIAADRASLVKQVVAYQQDLNKEQNKIMQGILKELNSIVGGIAKEKSYSLVLDSQAVIYLPNGNDITKDVSTQFNSKS